MRQTPLRGALAQHRERAFPFGVGQPRGVRRARRELEWGRHIQDCRPEGPRVSRRVPDSPSARPTTPALLAAITATVGRLFDYLGEPLHDA
ncbi:hypothetical protein GCM10017752_14800 [Streptomyces roseoviridis]